MTAKAPTELGASGKWTYPATPGMTVSSDTDPKATISIPVGTSVTFTWTVSNGKCAATAATVTLSNYAVPASADAGKDQVNCNNTSFTMTAKAPTELGASGKWTYPATPGMTVSSDTDPKATISIPVGTSVTFTWTVSNGKCAATAATVTLSNYAVPAIADAGKNQVNCNNTSFTMTAKAPTELGASGKWTYPATPGMTVSSDTDPKATISIPVGTSVTFTWTVSNGKCAATAATVTLSNYAVPAIADAGKDQVNCNNTSFTMTAKAPTELGASGKWTYPVIVGMTVSSDTDPKATISIPVGTSVTFTWTVSNGTCAATSATVTLSNYAVPAIADAGKNQVNCNNTNFTMTAKAPTELGASGKWTYPVIVGMTVSSDTDPKATISIPVGTSVTFTWTVSNGKCAATSATVTLSNYAVPANADAGKNQVNCNNTSFTMTAKAPTELGASGKWTYPVVTGMTVSSDTDPKATISIPVGTSVTFTWTVSNGKCAATAATVTLSNYAVPAIADAGKDQVNCNNTSFTMTAKAPTELGASGKWTYPVIVGMTVSSDTDPKATISIPVGTSVTFTWTVSNGKCAATAATVTLSNYAVPAIADAGKDQINCNNTSFTMTAKAPTELGASGKWTYPATPGMTVSSDTDPKATISIPVGTSVTFTWTVSNGKCAATAATVTLSNYAVPASADAGKDQVNCNNTSFTMTAKAPTELGASGKWTYPAIVGMTVSSDTDPKATISIPVGTSVTFTWTVSNGTCAATSDKVTLSNYAVPAIADAGKDQVNCNNTNFTMTAKAPTELGASGKWTYPVIVGMTVSSDTDPKATISIPVGTSVTFTWTVSNGKCAATAATVTLSNYAVPAIADAGKDQANCNNTSFTMTAKAPTELGASGKWTYPATPGMTVSSDTDPKATISIPVGTSVTFTWTVSNGKCAATAATVTLSNYAVPAIADAGKDQANCNNTSFTMTAKAPTELGAAGKWTYPAIPGMTVSSDTDPKATISIPVGTSVTFTWTVSNGKCAATTATVTLSNFAVPAIADAGKNQVNCNNTSFTMTAKAPTELGASGKWTYPVIVGMTVSSDTDPKATISIPVGTSVTFTWTVSNGKCAATAATVTLSNYAVPAIADAGKDQVNCNSTGFTMTAKAPTELGASGKWTYPATPGMTVSSDTDPKATISIPVGTSVTFTWTVSNGICAATSDKVTLSNYAVPASADAGKDQVNCNNTSFTMTAKAPTELGASGKWTYPVIVGMTVSSDTDPKATISIPVGTSVKFTWTVSNGICAATSATVTLSNYAVPAIADAGKDQVNCNSTNFTMTAKAPTELGASGKWTYPVIVGMTVSSDTDPKATISIPMGNSVKFTWTVSNGTCAATSATVTLSNYAVPAIADAGKNQVNCNNTNFTMTAKAPTELGASGKWTYPVIVGMTVSSDTDPKATISIPVGTSVTFTWTVSNGKCAATAATVTLSNYAVPANADAGKDQVNCNNTNFTMTAKAPTELGASGKWTYPVIVGMTVSSDTDPKATISIPVGTSVTFTWTVSNGKCAATSATVTLSNYAVPAIADAGKDQVNCNNTSFTMTAKAPTELGASGKWTYPVIVGMTVSSDTDPKATISIPVGNSVKFTWTVSNGTCAATAATVTLSNYAIPAIADAGKDQVNCNSTSFTMNAKAPTELGASGKWTYPVIAGMTVSSDTDPKATISIPVGNSVKFTWTVSNGKCAATTATVTLSNYAVPAIADAGKNQVNCNSTGFIMNAKAPTELGAAGKWTYPVVTGMTVSSDTDPKATISIPVGNSVKFTWTVSNGTCAATSATITLSNYAVPAIADAGKDQVNCNSTSFTMTAKAPTELGASGKWTYPVIAGMTVSSDTDPKATISIPVGNSVKFTWTVSNGICAATAATVTLSNYAVPAIADAGKDQVNCNSTSFTMNAKAPTELGAAGKWTYPVIAGMTVSSDTDPKATISIPVGNSVKFTWTVSNGKCAATSATITLSNYAVPAKADAGLDQKNCNNTSFTMNAKAPTELGAAGKWTYPATPGMTVSSNTDPKATISIPVGTSITFTWTVSNGTCAATSDQVILTNYAIPAVAKAGKDQENCNNPSFTLNGNAPTEYGAVGTWTVPAGTTGVTITNPNQANTTVTVTAGQSVTFTWTITNGTCAATADKVVITNYATANKANAGPDQKICGKTDDFKMAANTPSVATAKGIWTDISRIPGKATIKSPNDPFTNVTVPIGDTVVLQWAIGNGVCDSTFSRVTIINYKTATTANAGPDQEKCNTTADFKMSASAPGATSATGVWTDVSRIPSLASIKEPNNPLTAVTVPLGDTVILKWTVTNGACASSSSTVTLINYAKAADANAGPDQEMCNATGDFTMAADALSVPSAKGFWSIVKGSAVIKSINNPASGVNVNVGDTVTLRWTVTNGVCSATWDDVTLINYRSPVKANAGANSEHCNVDTFHMHASDPGVAGAIGTWVVTSSNASLINIAGINKKDAIVTVPAGETAQLTWVVSNGVCDATSSSVTLINRKPILGNTITADQTVCATETPMAISSNVLTGGNGIYTYQWQKSTTSATGPFTNITGATGDTYQPPVLTANTWYRRVVASGACIDNTSNAVKITVVTLSPIVTSVPPAITTECIQGKDYTTLFSTPVFSHAPYNNENLTITYNDATVVSSACLSTITRTWTAKDRCGLMVTASQTITIRDTKAPVFTTSAPADITVDCDKVPAKVDLTAKDDCAGDIIVPVVEVRQDMPGSCSNNYQLIRTWTAKDACNTGVTLRQVITVKDMTAPVFDMPAPADTTVDCDKIPTGINLTAKDNCTPGVITVVPKDSIVRNTSNCASNYLIYRKWTAFDECGNARAVQQIISVQDTTKPVFNMPTPKDTVVDCDKVPAWTTITATDNCTSNIQVFTSSKTVKLPGSCAGNYQEIRTWTATDDCGNNTSIQQIITVQDTTKPVFTVKPPADTTVSCDNIPAPATDVKVSDNCSTIGNGLTLSRKIYTESIPGACASNYRIIRLWTAKDACGNTSTVTQVVTVKDTTRPVIMPAPADVVIFCQDKIPTPPVLTATDNCDAAFPKRAIYTEDPFVKDICNGYTIVRRWSIMDACGNRADDVTQRVIVKPCAKPQLEANLPANCSDMPNIALHAVGNVSIPTYTLVSVTPANAVTGLPMTQNNNVFNLNGATSASFIITDGVTGCSSDTMTYNLTYIQKPVVNLGNDTTICGGNSLVLDAGAANFAYSIKWSTGATTQRINITAAGTYWVNVSNGQCSTTDTIHVGLVPTPLVTIPDTTICRGQSVKLDAYVDGAQYLWSNGSTASSILVSTQEQFWVKVMKTGCITIDTIKVSVNPPPDISLSRDTAICPDQSIMLTVNSNGGRIQWQTGETSNSIVVNKPGGYWVAVSRDNCVVRDTVNVRMKPTIKLDLGPDKNICPGATVTLDGTNPDAISYLWNDGDPNPVKQVTQAGKYKLAVMDRFCQQVFMDSVKVNITGLPKIDLGRDTTLCKGETLILRAEGGGITGARWDNGTSGPTLTVTNGGTYTVTVFNDCGTATDNITVDFIQCEPKPTVPNAFSPNGDGRNDVFRPIVRGQMFEYELRIFNRWGELIFITSDDHRGWDGKYKGTPVDVGTYVWWLSYKKVAGGKSNVLKGEVTVVR
ncbi:gliding motility-associated C-terminal domain-containing protein [Chitinophaga niastensis]|nr:gliding motility-associated C-terminal domain-containing protein [Chitinophaga niastensis]